MLVLIWNLTPARNSGAERAAFGFPEQGAEKISVGHWESVKSSKAKKMATSQQQLVAQCCFVAIRRPF